MLLDLKRKGNKLNACSALEQIWRLCHQRIGAGITPPFLKLRTLLVGDDFKTGRMKTRIKTRTAHERVTPFGLFALTCLQLEH